MEGKEESEAGEVRESIANLKQDMLVLREDLRAIVDALKSDGKEHIKENVMNLADRMRKRAKAKLEQLEETLDDAKDYGRHAVESVKTCVEERPMTTVFVTLGLGILMGRLLRGHRR